MSSPKKKNIECFLNHLKSCIWQTYPKEPLQYYAKNQIHSFHNLTIFGGFYVNVLCQPDFIAGFVLK